MSEHPAWPWLVFVVNTILIAFAVASIFLLGLQQRQLLIELNVIDRKLVHAIKANQNNVEVVAKKAGVPEHKIQHPDLPVIPYVK